MYWNWLCSLCSTAPNHTATGSTAGVCCGPVSHCSRSARGSGSLGGQQRGGARVTPGPRAHLASARRPSMLTVRSTAGPKAAPRGPGFQKSGRLRWVGLGPALLSPAPPAPEHMVSVEGECGPHRQQGWSPTTTRMSSSRPVSRLEPCRVRRVPPALGPRAGLMESTFGSCGRGQGEADKALGGGPQEGEASRAGGAPQGPAISNQQAGHGGCTW